MSVTNNLLEEFKAKLHKQESPLAPMLYVYGNAGMGKSSLAATFPSPFFLMTEQAFPNNDRIEGRAIYAKTYDELMDGLRSIYTILQEARASENKSDFPIIKTLVLDNMSGIDQLIRNDIMATKGKKVELFAFGQGYELLKDYWVKEQGGLFKAIKAINEEFGIAVILIDHAIISGIALPGRDPFNRYCPATSPKITNHLMKLMDEIFFIDSIYNEQVEDLGFGKKHLKVSTSSAGLSIRSGNGQAQYTSKSRYGLPTSILYRQNEGFKILEPYLPAWYKDATQTPPEAQEATLEAQDSVSR